ncbi:glycosyltransferase family 4 protein [Agrococcus jenensis]|uniref:Glycosyl transferase family 1 n=1 Tax=Agrococcus jenensis TaxID=46353 RepID=A0A3N2AT77_9MICO|nr:glycosyltransferase family 4 protein [Agrococcus jenensis]ROR66247.1 glycosyl transferase family 1 [Agrococcus jenensis]
MSDAHPREGSVRVAFFDHSNERGGAEMALARVLRSEVPWSATLVTPRRASRETVFDALAPGVHHVEIGVAQPPLASRRGDRLAPLGAAARIMSTVLALTRAPELRAADVFVANTTRSGVYVALAARVLSKPFVLHLRDRVEPAAIGGLATQLMRRIALPGAAAVVANSQATLATTDGHLRTERAVVLPSAAGLEPSGGAAPIVRPTVQRVGMVARIDPWKGQELLIRAFASVEELRSATLDFLGAPAFGHDAYVDDLRRLATELGLQERVRFLGHVADVAQALQDLDICVQCSIRPEPLGQNVLQYLSSGRPTIVADEGGPSEWITHDVNGLKFRPRDERDLSAQLRLLAADSERRARMSAEAQRTPGLLTDVEVAERLCDLVSDVARAS